MTERFYTAAALVLLGAGIVLIGIAVWQMFGEIGVCLFYGSLCIYTAYILVDKLDEESR